MGSSFEILAHGQSPLGLLCLRRRELLGSPGTIVTEITLNHEFLMSSFNTGSERALATVAIDMHGGDDLAVLVGGLGLGYTAQAALATQRVRHVEVVEFLPQVAQWLADGLLPLSSELTADARLAVALGDIYARLAKPPTSRYDVILIDVDHNPDERLEDYAADASRSDESGFFYTAAGLELAKQHLQPGGVLAVWSSDENSPFAETLRTTFTEVRIEPIEFDNVLIDEVSTDLLFFARDPVA
ncbi:MAG: spermidine synthase [Planctomycetota bacterium]